MSIFGKFIEIEKVVDILEKYAKDNKIERKVVNDIIHEIHAAISPDKYHKPKY